MSLLNLLEVNASDLQNLNEYQSVKILERLFRSELMIHNLKLSTLELCTEPKKPDEGVDALINEDIPKDLDIIPSGKSIFQFKATTAHFRVEKELFHKLKDKETIELKPLISKYLKEGANYVLINTKKKLNSKDKIKLSEKITQAIQEVASGLTVNIRIYDVDDIARWCNKFLNIKLEFGKLPFAKHFFEWKEEIWNNLKSDLIITDDLKSKIWNFLTSLKSTETNIRFFRILGPPGIGRKTLITVTLDKLPNLLQSNIIIIDLEITDISDISKALYYYAITEGILIILNCEDNFHHRIIKMIDWSKTKNLKVITVNSSVVYDKNKEYDDTEIIEVTRWNDNDIEKLINSLSERTHQNTRHQIIKFSEGIPQFTLSLHEMLGENRFQFREFQDIEAFCESIVEYLIEESHFERAILIRTMIGFSLFSSLGWYTLDIMEMNSEGIFEYKYKNNEDIFYEVINLEDNKYTVEQIITYLRNKNILSQRGRLIYLSPRPLAIYLLTKYLEKDSFFEYFKRILSSGSHHFLNKFIERLVDLSSENIGIKVIEYILESDYFNSWLDFNDLKKSDLFLKLSKINNRLTINKLSQLFQDIEISDLKNQLLNRRNLVYSLEHIIWLKETFRPGMKILLQLSLAENESYANNASNVFADKFSIYLPGTEASLEQRLSFLKNLNDSNDFDVIMLILSSLRRAFGLEHFSRSVSAEIQGFKSLPKEYIPSIQKEINSYIIDGFHLLYKHLCHSNLDISKEAFDILALNFSTFYKLDLWDNIKIFLDHYIKKDENHRFDVLDLFKRYREREGYKFSNFRNHIKKQLNNPDYDGKDDNSLLGKIIKKIEIELSDMAKVESNREERIDAIIEAEIEKVQPETNQMKDYENEILNSFSLLDEIQKYVKSSATDWINKGIGFEEYMDQEGNKYAENINQSKKDYNKIVKYLMQNDGMHLFYIAWNLGKLDTLYTNREAIINIFLELKDNRKVEFITGYFTNMRLNNPEQWIEILKEIERKEGLSHDLFDLALKVKFSAQTIELIKKLCNEKIIDQYDLMQLGFGNRIINLDLDSYKNFVAFYFDNIKFPLEIKREILGDHLLIFERYFKENEDSINEVKDILLKVLIDVEEYEEYEVIDEESNFRVPKHINLSYLWKDLVLKLINIDKNTIKIIREKILENLLKYPMSSNRADIQDVFIAFTNFETKETWDGYAQKFTDGSEIYKYYQFYFDYNFLKLFPDEWIIDLCRKNSDEFPQVIIEIFGINLMRFDKIPNLIIHLLETFPDNKQLRNNLTYLLEKGVQMYLPGRSSEFPINRLKKLRFWRKNAKSIVLLEWLDDAIQYQMRAVERLKIKDEEEFPEANKEVLEEFYDKEKWINSIKDKYKGEIIAFAKIKNDWTIIASAKEEDVLNEILEEILNKENKVERLRVQFRDLTR